MPQNWTKLAAGTVMAAVLSGAALGAMPMAPVNDLPNPYQSVDNWFKLPDGRKWGSTAGVAIAPDGKSVWAVDRCGGNGCVGSKLNPIMKFDANGNLVAQFGAGMFAFPHGITVDKDENVYVTDAVLEGERRRTRAVCRRTLVARPHARQSRCPARPSRFPCRPR